jgi:mono/diheme cytochrome c family protein
VRAALAFTLLLGGCDLSMQRQEKLSPQGAAQLWPDGPALEPPPAGTIAADDAARATVLATQPPLTPALIARGQERYAIYCSVCHGARGMGDGTVVQRGFPAPPPFTQARLVAAPPRSIVDVITHGHGVMYSYADRVEPADRWAIAAYVRVLQRAGAPR